MDKYEYKLRAEEIKTLIAKRKFPEALKIAETIDWTRVRSVMMLCTVSDLYKINRRYEESKELLLLAYEHHPGSRMIVYSLCELSIKMGEVVQAIEYYKEFVQSAPSDNGRFILQYKLYEAQDVSLEERIAVLEEFEKREYKEKWMYELAYLYHRVGLATKCVEECDQLILWFGEGRYVDKAMELKMLHVPLSAEQQARYDEAHDPLGMRAGRPEETKQEREASLDTRENYELPIQKGQAGEQEETTGLTAGPSERMDTEEMVTDYSQEADAEEEEEPLQAEPAASVKLSAEQAAILRGDTMAQLADEEVEQIRIKPMDMSQYNTINLQKELAKSMNELFSSEEAQQIEEAAKAQEQEPEPTVPEKTAEMQEIFFEEDSETIAKKPAAPRPAEPEEPGRTAGGREELQAQTEGARRPERVQMPETVRTGQLSLADMPSMSGLQMPAAQDLAQVEVPEKIAPYLSQEYDGQISLVVPEKEAVEKQITGQLNIQDVLTEWERLKKENEKKRMEEVRQRVLEQTGAMFTQFEAAARDGILEQLEKEARAEQKNGKKPVRKRRPEPSVSGSEEEPAQGNRSAGEKPAADRTRTQRQHEKIEEQPEELLMEPELARAALAEAAQEETLQAALAQPEATDRTDPEGQKAREELEETSEEAFESSETEEEDALREETDEEEEDALREETDEEEEGTQDGEEDEKKRGKRARAAQRIRPQGRALSKEEKALFGSFLTTRESREHMIGLLDALSLDAAAGNVLLTGDAGDGSMKLAKALVKYMKAAEENFSGKVAKTTGEAMNLRDLEKVLSRMPNGALMIEGAGKMTPETVENLIGELRRAETGILLILEDTRRNMNKLTESCPDMENVFEARFDITQMNNSSLVQYGRKYAESMEYTIDEMGVLELYTRIEDMQTADHSVAPAEVREIVDEAIGRANRKTVGHFFDILLGKRYDEEDMIVLHEKDFM